MTWSFKPEDVKATDLKDAKPGDFLCALRAGATYELWLRLAGSDARTSMMVHLTGSKAMTVWPVQAPRAVPTLLVASGADVQLEIDDSKGVGDVQGTLGTLLIADSGAYFVASMQSESFTDEGCISLATWKFVAFHDVGTVRASFSTWRLVDSRESSNRKVPLSVGEWFNG